MTNTMPVLTDEQRQELIDEIDYNRKNCFLSSKTELLMQIAEAALTAPAVADVVSWNHPNEERTCSVDLRDFHLQPGKLYAAPPVPTLKLPDELLWSYHDNISQAECESWNNCIAETKRLNGVTK